MNDNYSLSVEWEAAQSLVMSVLKEDMTSLHNDMLSVHGKTSGMVFSLDKDKDISEMAKHLDAFKLIIKYYGGNV